MVINIASFGGRTHLLDTARELARQGNTVRFYSYVPTSRAVRFGLPGECSYSLYWWALPFLILFKIFGFHHWNQRLYWNVFDIFTAFYMKPCDVFIGQSPMHNYSIKRAKKKFGALTVLERGAEFVTDYNQACEAAGEPGQGERETKKDLEGYNLPDFISVGSLHVKQQFLTHGFDAERLFVNVYGFDAAQFEPTVYEGDYDMILVGRWSKMKGSHIITRLCTLYGYKFLHVGPLVDSFPSVSNMTHVDAVEQRELKRYYAQARIFVFPSFTDGFGMVLMQAAVCGLPIVCSTHCGGGDVALFADDKSWVVESPTFNVEDFHRCIELALKRAATQTGKRQYIHRSLDEASWEGYGKRYNQFLHNHLQQHD